MIPKIVKRVFLKTMPFDRWDTTNNEYVHATGCDILLDNGSWLTEYEDMVGCWDEAPNCIYEDEEDEEEDDWVPDISAEDYAEWTGKGWLY